jgi:hypothetical protein
MAELAGMWIYRRFNPTFVSGNLTPQEDALILAGAHDDVVLTLRPVLTSPNPMLLEGTIEWPGGGLNLNGRMRFLSPNWASGYVPGEPVIFDLVGTGRPGSETDGWEYRYHGHLMRTWANGVDQRPTLVGSVIRQKCHNGQPGAWHRWAGEVFSFFAIWRGGPAIGGGPTMGWLGSWTYRSFHNEPQYPYLRTYPTAHSLILEESVFKLKTPTSTTLEGTIEWPAKSLETRILVLDIGKGSVRIPEVQTGVRPPEGGEPQRFAFSAIGRRGTETDGWEYSFDGQLTRNWPLPADAPANVPRLPALVGSVIREKAHGDSPAGTVYPFIAVRRD